MEKNYFTINGKQFQIDTKKENFLDELIKNYLKHKNIKVAVAVNYELIQKSKWKSKKILKGDEIEIVQPFFGG
ncbi:MAG: thiamine biosynthesis protein ThiS [alpha proteobacterium MED-G10]|jgi:thiamine biosynthesis protein ThiS|nr:MAG: thiamine biosynthesis protein ThiS [alpha proteobacterium MED-G10]|tara:strand:- start:892 stop:1110 length:219 start_codon:yes stop_codon:yes gene_type:complete